MCELETSLKGLTVWGWFLRFSEVRHMKGPPLPIKRQKLKGLISCCRLIYTSCFHHDFFWCTETSDLFSYLNAIKFMYSLLGPINYIGINDKLWIASRAKLIDIEQNWNKRGFMFTISNVLDNDTQLHQFLLFIWIIRYDKLILDGQAVIIKYVPRT